MTNQEKTADKKSPLLNYVGNFIAKRDNQLQDVDDVYSSTDRFDKDSVVIKTGEGGYRQTTLDNRISGSTDMDYDDLSFASDPIVETQEGGEQVYQQQIYVRQYQPPTPDPVDIRVQEVYVKPKIQRPPIHVHVTPNKNRDEQRTPSPILIQSSPPEPPLTSTDIPVFYNKYIPTNHQATPRQIVIHRHPELPPKPRPIVIEQWLPNKPPPKRITYRHINRDEFIQNETERQRNRYIEHKRPRVTVELEIIRLPIIKLDPKEYQNRSHELTQLDNIRTIVHDPNTLFWRI